MLLDSAAVAYVVVVCRSVAPDEAVILCRRRGQVCNVGYHHSMCEEKLARMALVEAAYDQSLQDVQTAVKGVKKAEKRHDSENQPALCQLGSVTAPLEFACNCRR